MKHSITRSNRMRDLHDQLPSAASGAPVPPAPPVLAAEMGAWLWARTGMLMPVWEVVHTVSAWPGMVIAPDRSGMCLRLGGVVLGELRWSGRLDLPFGREMADRLVSEEMVARDPDKIDATRVVCDVRTVADVDHAVWLLRLAYLSVDPTKTTCS